MRALIAAPIAAPLANPLANAPNGDCVGLVIPLKFIDEKWLPFQIVADPEKLWVPSE